MSENLHYDRAKSRLHNGTDKEVMRAQAEATLALAYEQRTANLIAVYGMVSAAEEIHPDSLTTFLSERFDGHETAKAIYERLAP